MVKGGDNAWTSRYNALTEAAQTVTDEETARRDAKTARLKEERLAAEADEKPSARRRRQDDGKRPKDLDAGNDE